MNTLAVLIGLVFGVLTTLACYVVSMITSGLFGRSFYRLYARILISICSVMLLVPGLRWLAIVHPKLAAFGLTAAQYIVVGVLFYGVYRFNRDHLKRLYLERKTATFFMLGTLANAAVVTLIFLHVAITASPSWEETSAGYVGAGHYGPLLVILAAMIFHTDHHLKQSLGDQRQFSRFTFIGYAVSFLGLALSMVPYIGEALSQLELTTIDDPLLENFFSAQALLLAIVLYGWLVVRYESIPPLFLLLLAVVAEYHVLVTQWVVRSFGPESWGLASLPLFAGLVAVDRYFSNWDRRKQRLVVPAAEHDQPISKGLRFMMPFRIVEMSLGILLLVITLWTRLIDDTTHAEYWLVSTFGIYAAFFVGMAVVRSEPRMIYVSGALAALAVMLGLAPLAGPWSIVLLGVLSTTWAAIALLGERGRLKLVWRTPMVDVALLGAGIITLVVFYRHLLGTDAYHFQAVSMLDGMALLLAAATFLLCAVQYRSQVPVFAAIVAVAAIVPPWCAAVGFLCMSAVTICKNSLKKEKAIVLEERVSLFGVSKLPRPGVLPELIVQPLSMGTIPLAVLGLLISVGHVWDANFSPTVMIGAVLSALVLGWMTRTYRFTWLYALSFIATYFAIHTVAHGLILDQWPVPQAVAAHWLIAATITLVAWSVATGYAAWCSALLRRVAEQREAEIRERRSYHAGLLYDLSLIAAVVVLAGVFMTWIGSDGASAFSAAFLFVASAMITGVFCHAATVYQSQIGSYLSLIAFTLTFAQAAAVLSLADWEMTAVAGAGLVASVASWFACGRHTQKDGKISAALNWKQPLPYLQAKGFDLWFRPLGLYAIGCSAIAVLAELGLDHHRRTIEIGLTTAAPLTLALAGTAYLFSTRAFRLPAIYLLGITMIFASVHALLAVHFGWLVPSGDVHLLTAACLSLTGCCLAATCASLINGRLAGIDADSKQHRLNNRAFYAGTLQHFSFTAAMVVLFLLVLALLGADVKSASSIWLHTGTSLLLAVTFGAFGLLYDSRVQTYAVLAAICLGLLSVVSGIVEEFEVQYSILALASAGLLFALVGWTLQRSGKDRQSNPSTYGTRRFDCWEAPPWPWITPQKSVWAVPLVQFAVLLALTYLLQLANVAMTVNNDPLSWWLVVTPIYLAAATFFVVSHVRSFGFVAFLLGSSASDVRQRWSGENTERGIHYVISLVLLVTAIQLTLHLGYVQSLPFELAVSWHLLTGSILALVGWTLAVQCTTHFARQNKSPPEPVEPADEVAIYGGLLHHVTAFGAAIVLGTACSLGVPPKYVSSPAMVGLVLLILYFALSSITYLSAGPVYLGLLTIGLTTLHVTSMMTLVLPDLAPLEPPAMALLGLGMMMLASLLGTWGRQQLESPEQVASEASPWLQPISWNRSSLSRTWQRPLQVSSMIFAAIGLTVMLLHRWVWNDTWNTENEQALVTYSCVAITFALGAHRYNLAFFSYAATVVVAFSAIPQMLISRVPVTHLGIGLATLAIAFWVAGYVCERCCTAYRNRDAESAALIAEQIYERPLIRSSALLALVAIAHSLFVWKTWGWSVSQAPVVFACALGAITLLLNARSLNLLHRITRARALVYLACAALTGCSLAITSAAGSFDVLGPVSAITALVLAIAALTWTEKARAVKDANPALAESRQTFGEPISNSACVLMVLAVVASLIAVVGSIGGVLALLRLPSDPVTLSQLPLLPASITMMIASVICVLSVRTEREMRWLYPGVIAGSLGLLLLAESHFQWSVSTFAVASLILMNLLVLLARLVRIGRKPVESLLGLSESNCDAPLIQWPLVFATSLLVMQGLLVAYIVIDVPEFSQQWPWLWTSLLVGGLFLHLLYLESKSTYVHLLVWTAFIGAAGFYAASDALLSRDELVVAVGFGWAAMALGFLSVGHTMKQDADKKTVRPLFKGAGNSVLTIAYLVGSGVVIAPVVLSSQAISVGISLGVISACWLWMAWVSGEEVLGYATVLGFFATLLYVAHDVLGTSLIGNPFTAFLVVGYSFMLYGINILVSRTSESKIEVLLRPTYYLALALPLCLIVTIPMDQRAPAALALLAAGAFYLLVARQSDVRWALYVAAGCANVAIYLWIPVAREATGLIQLYVIPAAITVLVFAQLHRHELNAQVLTSIRLAAAGSILAVSTYEVFFSKDPGLLQFVIVLVLSLTGTATGIALRIKPFVYAGVAFLVINVLGQLGLQLHHQGGVIRAVILIGTGLLVLVIMIFFNVHRERILRSYRGFVADKSWE